MSERKPIKCIKCKSENYLKPYIDFIEEGKTNLILVCKGCKQEHRFTKG